MPLGAAMRVVYKRHGMTQERLAGTLGTTQNTISRWVNGSVKPSIDHVARFEDACGERRGNVLRLAGYVIDDSSTEAMISNDPALNVLARLTVLSVYRQQRSASKHRPESS